MQALRHTHSYMNTTTQCGNTGDINNMPHWLAFPSSWFLPSSTFLNCFITLASVLHFSFHLSDSVSHQLPVFRPLSLFLEEISCLVFAFTYLSLSRLHSLCSSLQSLSGITLSSSVGLFCSFSTSCLSKVPRLVTILECLDYFIVVYLCLIDHVIFDSFTLLIIAANIVLVDPFVFHFIVYTCVLFLVH